MDLVVESFRLLHKYGLQYIQIELEKKYPEISHEEITESIENADALYKAADRGGHLHSLPFSKVGDEALIYLEKEVPNLSKDAYGLALSHFMLGYIR